MDPMICPHCRQPTNRPTFFPRAQQQIFDIIWFTPNISKDFIEKIMWGSNVSSDTLLYVHISKIRKSLFNTNFRLVGSKSGYRIETINAD